MKILIYLAFFILLFFLYVRYLESKSVFYPSRLLASTPEAIGLAYENVSIMTEDDVHIHGWLVKAPSAKSTLLFFHGNAGNIADRLGKIELLHGMNLNVLIIDYRGYGQSGGSPTEGGIYQDALAAYEYVKAREDLGGQNVIVYGASLGGAVAVDLGSRRPVAALVVDSSFSSAADIAKGIYPFVPSFLIKTKLDSMIKIKQVVAPKLFFHSIDDLTVPYKLGRKLYEAAIQPKKFIDIVGDHTGGHLHDREKFEQELTMFLKDCDLI